MIWTAYLRYGFVIICWLPCWLPLSIALLFVGGICETGTCARGSVCRQSAYTYTFAKSLSAGDSYMFDVIFIETLPHIKQFLFEDFLL